MTVSGRGTATSSPVDDHGHSHFSATALASKVHISLEMSTWKSLAHLTGIFIAWKALLLIVVGAAPGIGYDTSTTHLPSTNKLIRWDAIYLVQTAQRGRIFEQEWAFGVGQSTIISMLSSPGLENTSLTAILLAHFSHYLSIICLWHTARILARQDGCRFSSKAIPFTACCLHILSPAGVFLSAPYSESTFSALNMFGFWLYLEAFSSNSRVSLSGRCMLVVAAGLSFGGATIVRSNGVLSGIPLLIDAISMTYKLLVSGDPSRSLWEQSALLLSTVAAGLSIAAGLVFPQILAYQEYCWGPERRPWCLSKVPLIFSYVQSHYWHVYLSEISNDC